MNPSGTILITGAASGMGRAMAVGMAAGGARVGLMDADAEGLERTAGTIRAKGGAAIVLTADVTDEDQVMRAVQRCRSEAGEIVALVNNAGIGRGTIRPDFVHAPIRLWEVTAPQWRRIMDVNVNGFFLVTRAVLPGMIAAGKGRIVTVTTSLDTMLRGGSATYGGSKAAVEAFMAILVEDLAGTGVSANVLVPGGPVDTPMIPDDGTIDRAKMIPPDAMVAPLAWLLSDAAAGVTGRRFIAATWEAGDEGAPIGWPQLGSQMIFRAGKVAAFPMQN